MDLSMNDGLSGFADLLNHLCASRADADRGNSETASAADLPFQQQVIEGANEIQATSAAAQHSASPSHPLSPDAARPTIPLNPFFCAAYLQFQQSLGQNAWPQLVSAAPQQAYSSSTSIFGGSNTAAMAALSSASIQRAAEIAMALSQVGTLGLHERLRQVPFIPFLPSSVMANNGAALLVGGGGGLSASSFAGEYTVPSLQLQFPPSSAAAGSGSNRAQSQLMMSPMSTDSETSNPTSTTTTTNTATTSGSSFATDTSSSSPSLLANGLGDQQNHNDGSTMSLLPSNDKEGWCRNKKYIQVVKKGYKCLVCNKIYGRYNSVSYHVTIYHRNPPIKCEEDGCQFTTREARYIHFHKYYRHQIPLPGSIDLASRKCPIEGCRHVSKSPAMLDKHMHRHVADSLKEGVYTCGNCQPRHAFPSHETMLNHLREVHTKFSAPVPSALIGKKATVKSANEVSVTGVAGDVPRTKSNDADTASVTYPCELCQYRSRTLESLEQHRMFKHTNAFFNLVAVGGRQPHKALKRRRTVDCLNPMADGNEENERVTTLNEAQATVLKHPKLEEETLQSAVANVDAAELIQPLPDMDQ